MSRIDGYVIVTRAGTLKRVHGSPARVHMTQGTAIRAAKNQGDSVVPIFVDLDVAPVFIRGGTP